MARQGKVYLIGAGPGDPGLFSLRGVEVLGRAGVVIYDGLVNRDLLRYAPPTAEIIYGGKHDRHRCVSQEELSALLVARARAGQCVVRLKGGDPYLFGRGGEEAEVLAKAGIPFEVVPGVSSVQSVPCYAGIPITHRHFTSSVTIVTGHEDPASPTGRVDWANIAQSRGTIVVLMGLRNLHQIASVLIRLGRQPDTPVAVISHGTTAKQETAAGTLATIADLVDRARLSPPAVIVIGDVVRLRRELNWFESRPLFGQRVVVTQRRELARPLVESLRAQGAAVLEIPATRFVPPPDTGRLERALAELQFYDWIVFSNPRGVEVFFDRFFKLHDDLRELGRVRLGAYGPVTAQKLREWHVQPAAVAADHKPAAIVEALRARGDLGGQRLLLLQGQRITNPLADALRELGATVDAVTCYAGEPERSDPTGAAAKLTEEGADWIVFASALAIRHFHARFDLPQLLARFPGMRLAIASADIRWALDRLGLSPAVIAKPNGPEGLVKAIVQASRQESLSGAESTPAGRSLPPQPPKETHAVRVRPDDLHAVSSAVEELVSRCR